MTAANAVGLAKIGFDLATFGYGSLSVRISEVMTEHLHNLIFGFAAPFVLPVASSQTKGQMQPRTAELGDWLDMTEPII